MAAWVEQSRHAIDQWISQDMSADPGQGVVEEAMRYSLLSGGKRLRPQLVLASGEYLGLARERLRPAALAVEYLHTYSLIHDDLPAMDNDDLRRGRPTLHKAFGEANAILAGDALLTAAFEKMTELLGEGFPAPGVVMATRRLAVSSGREGLVRGQAQDLAAERRVIELSALRAIHEKKTGELMAAALAIPALLMGDEASAEVLSRFGVRFGLAFQIVDDILNVVGDSRQLGKATGSDAELEKATYPRLLGLERTHALLQEQRLQALECGLEPGRAELLQGLLQWATDRRW